MRILQVVGGMNRHGVETWLMHLLRSTDRSEFQMDFLVHTPEHQPYEDEIKKLGSRVIRCLHPSRPWMYAQNFKQVLQEYGSYDIIHSHIHHYSGFVLRLAQQAGIPVRIVHSHNDTSPVQKQANLSRKAYYHLMKHWISRYATVGIAASQLAAAALFGSRWQSDSRLQVLHYGIDLAPFKTPVNSAEIRSQLGIADNAFVIGHVGRFYDQKNHVFLVEIFHEIVKREPNACLLLVGEGPLRGTIEQKLVHLELSQQVIFAGLRSDVHQLLSGAMDIFLFPSLYEGLPLALIEAQAAGLPCIFSDVISEETDILPVLTQRLSLSQSASQWAEAVLAAQKKPPVIVRSDAAKAMIETDFNALNSLKQLERVYTEASNSKVWSTLQRA